MKFIGIAPLLVTATIIAPPSGAVYFGAGAGVVDTAITPSAGALSLEGYQPGQAVTITPSAGSFAITGIAPAVNRAGLITPSVGDLSVTGIAPANDRGIIGTAGELATSVAAPTVQESSAGNTNYNPVAGVITIGGVAPTVEVTDHRAATPLAGGLTLDGYAPTVSVPGQTNVVPSVGALALAGYAPSVQVPVSITAGLAGQLDGVTVAAAGTVPVVAASSISQADVSISSDSSVSVVADLGSQLDGATLSAEAVLGDALTADLSATLEGVEAAAETTLRVAALVVAGLDGNSLSASGWADQAMSTNPTVPRRPFLIGSVGRAYRFNLSRKTSFPGSRIFRRKAL